MKNFKIGKTVILFFIISCMMSIFASCNFFSSFSEKEDSEIKITGLSMSKSEVSVSVGEMVYINVNVKPTDVQKDIKLVWSFDSDIISADTSSSWGITLTGLKEGQTSLKCSYNGYEATCIVTVQGYVENYKETVEPYIYSNTTIIQTSPGVSEKVFVSLYGGSAADIDGYSWIVDNPSVASIEPTGQYCIVTAKGSGYARIKITHTKAAYPYYMGVYVFEDPSKVTYITTSNNILTMNMDGGEQNVSVSLVNGFESSRDNDFKWEIISESSEKEKEIENPFSFVSNGNKAILTPQTSGYCTLRITHPDAVYPLDILCRVVTIVKNVYIEPDKTFVLLNGSNEEKVTSKLVNFDSEEYVNNDFKYEIQDTDIAQIIASVGDTVYICGLKNGSTKLIISHPKSSYTREVLLISNNQIADAIDSSCYITTSNNYIRTKEGNSPSEISVMLKGGIEGDENNYKWSVENFAADGSNASVISLETPTGEVSVARKASQTYIFGNAYITPIKEGTAVIKVSHPKVLYETEILVKVLSKDSILTEPLYFRGEGLVRLLNGTSYDYTVSLNGSSKKASDNSDISWTIDNSKIVLNGNEDKAQIKAPALGTGSTISHMSISHPKVDVSKTVVVMTADDEETLMNMKCLYTDKNYYNIEAGSELSLSVDSCGFDATEDFSLMEWSVDVNSIIDFSCKENDRRTVKIKALKSGTVRLKAKFEDCECVFTITVYPVGAVQTEPEVYFTTSNNVIHIANKGDIVSAYISAINLPSAEYKNIKWNCEDSSIVRIISNGTSCIIKAIAEGQTVLSISHPDSQNVLKIYVRIGNEYEQKSEEVYQQELIPYIKAPNLISLLISDSPKKIQATLANYTGTKEDGFAWSIADENIARFSAVNSNGTAFVKGTKTGYTEITCSNTETSVQKKILVVCGETEEDIINLLSQCYFTTTNNVVALYETSEKKVVNVNVFNLEPSLENEIDWKTSDESVCSVIGNGTSATITAEGEGKATVTAFHENSMNSIVFYVYVGSEAINNSTGDNHGGSSSSGTSTGDNGNNNGTSSSENSVSVIGINCANVVTIAKTDQDKAFTASLIGYKGSDSDGFSFSIADESLARISSQSTNGTVYIQPVSVGYTELTVSHKFTDITKKVLVVVGETEAEAAEMLTSIKYLSTDNNVYSLNKGGKISVKILANNVSSYSSQLCKWSATASSVITVTGNGTSATIQGLSSGEAVITVTHPECVNSLQIFVFVGEIINSSGNGSGGSSTNGNGSSSVSPYVYITAQDVVLLKKDDQASKLQAALVNYNGSDTSGFSFVIDNTSVASISAQSTNGTAFIKPIQAGQAEITITHSATSMYKKVLVVVGNSDEELAGIKYLTTSNNVVSIGEGKNRTVSVSVKNSEEIVIDGYTWFSSDPDIVSVAAQGATAVFTGNSIGTAIITVSNKNCTYSLQIIAQVVDPIAAAANPYIQLTSSVITVQVGSSYTSITAELVGGLESDNSDFIWQTNDTSICAVYGQNEVGKIRALKEGTAYVTVSHPKAAYTAQLLVVCDKKAESECYISVPSSIISMKPTDSSQTITASLVNGTSTDKYNFKWTLDVYDVIDFVYSANVCTIEPKQQGQATITIHHPKAAYDQQIVVTVQEYSNFAFPEDYITITQGTVTFKTMQIPNTKVSTYVKYSTSDKTICTISGTKSTAQITAIKTGTANVYAELIASSTGVVQAKSEMMVYVKEAPVNTCYITSGSTIYTLNKGKSQTLSANLVGSGIVTSDQQNLKWETNDTDIISITGINKDGCVMGQSIYITANKSGEALITCSHEKAASKLQFYVVVPGTADKTVTLNKSNITLTKGSSGTTLKATIENAESSNDYNNLVWSVSNSGNEEICRVMPDKGQNVTIYPVNVGMAEVMVQLPDSSSVAKCTVLVQAGKSFVLESTAASVQPFETKKVKYTVSPPDANLTWTMNQGDDFFTYKDLGCDEKGVGYVQIEGLKEGSGNLYCVTDGNAKGNLSVKVRWDYEFALIGKTVLSITPSQTSEVEFKVNPVDADISVSSTSTAFEYTIVNQGNGTGKIIIQPKEETPADISISVSARNPNNKNELIGTKTITAKFAYTSLTPSVYIIAKNGNFSYFENNVLHVGDGETVALGVSISEPKVSWSIKNTAFSKVSSASQNSYLAISGNDKQFKIQNLTDVVEYKYYISEFYVPYAVYGGQELALDDFYMAKNNVGFNDYTAYYYVAYRGKLQVGTSSDQSGATIPIYENPIDCGEFGNNYSKIGRKHNASKDGTWMSKTDYESKCWYYRPATPEIKHWSGECACTAKDAQQTGNQPAVLKAVPDKTIVSDVLTDTLVFYIYHNGVYQKVEVPVYTVTRNCTKNQY